MNKNILIVIMILGLFGLSQVMAQTSLQENEFPRIPLDVEFIGGDVSIQEFNDGRIYVITDRSLHEKLDKLISMMESEVPTDIIDINTASLEKLISLPGIAETRAQDIIEARPFDSWDDLQDRVSGIGSATVRNLQIHGASLGSEVNP